MYCPSCGAEQPPGPVCIACGQPFRREAVGSRHVRRHRYVRRGIGARVAGCVTTLIAALVLVLAAAAFLTREPARAPGSLGGSDLTATATPVAQASFEATVGGQTIVVSEAELNRWLGEHEAELRPASDPRAEISPEGIGVHVRVYGFGATYRARPTVENGRFVLRDARVEGPLGIGFSAEQVTARLQAALDERLAQAGLRPVAVELEPGALRVTFEPVRE